MNAVAEGTPDVLQVCRNGHVITDLLRTYPEARPEPLRPLRCGHAGSLRHLRAAIARGSLRPGPGDDRPIAAPQFCATCGAAFPWSERAAPDASALVVLERLLRRLPLVVRQLRSRHGDRPPFRVVDEHDLADLRRALLPLHFDDVRLESRTPGYAQDTRTDLVLGPEKVALVLKRPAPTLAAQCTEDIAYYAREGRCQTLVLAVYDAEARMPGPQQFETTWSRTEGDREVRCMVIR